MAENYGNYEYDQNSGSGEEAGGSSSMSGGSQGGGSPFGGGGSSMGGASSQDEYDYSSISGSSSGGSGSMGSGSGQQMRNPFSKLIGLPGIDSMQDIFEDADMGGGDNPFAGSGGGEMTM
ncbi:MAG: hypothetical protein BRC52_02655 [Cyanobacteria bacterium SW_5_48_44]|nr:MAG: hypothetical protein BRC48_02075 [Cyanobacteria bacterium QS_9_48_30]PSP05228.1 MAG: hypothetical protein BRC54_09800 [Cyanobacteria bacterium SW_7_48_12]PSP23185.1 MAG: hypothetical protein BRC52_02655 [Cyanobacteria bacterium SW_5_48_44]